MLLEFLLGLQWSNHGELKYLQYAPLYFRSMSFHDFQFIYMDLLLHVILIEWLPDILYTFYFLFKIFIWLSFILPSYQLFSDHNFFQLVRYTSLIENGVFNSLSYIDVCFNLFFLLHCPKPSNNIKSPWWFIPFIVAFSLRQMHPVIHR